MDWGSLGLGALVGAAVGALINELCHLKERREWSRFDLFRTRGHE